MPRAQAYARELLERSEYLQKRIPELEQAYEDALVNVGTISYHRKAFPLEHTSLRAELSQKEHLNLLFERRPEP